MDSTLPSSAYNEDEEDEALFLGAHAPAISTFINGEALSGTAERDDSSYQSGEDIQPKVLTVEHAQPTQAYQLDSHLSCVENATPAGIQRDGPNIQTLPDGTDQDPSSACSAPLLPATGVRTRGRWNLAADTLSEQETKRPRSALEYEVAAVCLDFEDDSDVKRERDHGTTSQGWAGQSVPDTLRTYDFYLAEQRSPDRSPRSDAPSERSQLPKSRRSPTMAHHHIEVESSEPSEARSEDTIPSHLDASVRRYFHRLDAISDNSIHRKRKYTDAGVDHATEFWDQARLKYPDSVARYHKDKTMTIDLRLHCADDIRRLHAAHSNITSWTKPDKTGQARGPDRQSRKSLAHIAKSLAICSADEEVDIASDALLRQIKLSNTEASGITPPVSLRSVRPGTTGAENRLASLRQRVVYALAAEKRDKWKPHPGAVASRREAHKTATASKSSGGPSHVAITSRLQEDARL